MLFETKKKPPSFLYRQNVLRFSSRLQYCDDVQSNATNDNGSTEANAVDASACFDDDVAAVIVVVIVVVALRDTSASPSGLLASNCRVSKKKFLTPNVGEFVHDNRQP